MATGQCIEGDPVKVFSPTLSAYAITYNASAWANPGSGDWLYTCWFKGTTVNPAATTFETLFNLDFNDSGNGIDIYLVNTWVSAESGTLRIWYAGSVLQATIAQQGASVHNGKAHLLWFEKRSGTVSIYFDGILCTSGVRGTPSIGATPWTYFGTSYSQGATYRLNNSIGYVGLWANTTIPAVGRQAVYMAEARRAGVAY